MNKKYIFLCLLILIISNSCNNPKSILDINCKEFNLKHEVIDFKGCILHNLNTAATIDSLLFVIDETDSSYFAVFNINTNSLMFRFGKKGSGPGEMKWPLFINCFKKLNLFEVTAIQPEGCIQYDIDSLIHYKGEYYPKIIGVKDKDMAFLTVNRLNDSLYIGKGVFKQGQFATLNNKGDIMSISEKYPVGNESIEEDQMVLAMAYQGEVMSNPVSSKFVYIPLVGSIIEFCELKNNYKINKYKYYYFDYTKYNKLTSHTALLPDNIIGYNSLYTTSKCVYVLYSEKDIASFNKNPYLFNTVLVFDWSGKLIKKYHTDIGLRNIAISANDKIIYGVAANPEPKIVKFEL